MPAKRPLKGKRKKEDDSVEPTTGYKWCKQELDEKLPGGTKALMPRQLYQYGLEQMAEDAFAYWKIHP